MNNQETSWGLAGIGRHAGVCVELEEPLDGEGPWQLQLIGSGWNFRLPVSGKEDVLALSAFITAHEGQTMFATYRLGSLGATEAVIVKDSEFKDRFFLRIQGEGMMVGITIQNEEDHSLQKALQSLVRDFVK